MARRGLDRGQIVAAAAAIADTHGLAAVTLARVAADLDVRPPSLYSHIGGREGLICAIGLRGVGELGAAMRVAATGRAGQDAIVAIARAYRAYARDHPGCYAASLRSPPPGDREHEQAALEATAVLLAVLRAYALQDDEAIHAARAIRSALHGFVALEREGGFGLPLDVDASFEWLVARLVAALAQQPENAA